MPKKKASYLHKSVTFLKSDKEEMELHKKLKKLEHGQFSNETKAMWKERLKDNDN